MRRAVAVLQTISRTALQRTAPPPLPTKIMSSARQAHAFAISSPPSAKPAEVVFKQTPWPAQTEPLQPHELVARVEACGVCHTDFFCLGKQGAVPGHETIAVVEELGSAAAASSGLQVGDRIGLGWQLSSCGKCRMCVTGEPHLCSARKSFMNTQGGYASHIRWDSRFAFKIPEQMSSTEAAPMLCAGATVYSAITHNLRRPGARVGVVGIGGLGHLALQFARALGCETFALSRTTSKRDEALAFGASELLATTDAEAMARHANSFDLMLSTVPGSLDWGPYLDLMAPHGTVCVVGVPDKPMQIPGGPVILKELHVAGSLIASPTVMQDMLEFACRHNIRPKIEEIPLTEEGCAKAIRIVDDGSVRYRAVLVNDKKVM